MKYAYMCHFYANPLSVLFAVPSLDRESLTRYLTKTHLNAIRSLPSIRKFIEEKAVEKDTSEVESILFDDAYLISLLPEFINVLENTAGQLREALIVLSKLSEMGNKSKSELGDLYVSVLEGALTPQTPFIRELLQLQRYESLHTDFSS